MACGDAIILSALALALALASALALALASHRRQRRRRRRRAGRLIAKRLSFSHSLACSLAHSLIRSFAAFCCCWPACSSSLGRAGFMSERASLPAALARLSAGPAASNLPVCLPAG